MQFNAQGLKEPNRALAFKPTVGIWMPDSYQKYKNLWLPEV